MLLIFFPVQFISFSVLFSLLIFQHFFSLFFLSNDFIIFPTLIHSDILLFLPSSAFLHSFFLIFFIVCPFFLVLFTWTPLIMLYFLFIIFLSSFSFKYMNDYFLILAYFSHSLSLFSFQQSLLLPFILLYIIPCFHLHYFPLFFLMPSLLPLILLHIIVIVSIVCIHFLSL